MERVGHSYPAAAAAQSRWVLIRRPNPEAVIRLFCLPYAGGGALVYRRWGELLPPSIEVCAVQLPGRENRLDEPAHTNIVPLVEEAAAALRPFVDRPFAFFGHSMGARVAFDIAQRLRDLYGLSPCHLFMSGHPAPQLPRDEPVSYDLPRDEFVEELRSLKGTTAEVLDNPDLMDLMMPLLRADFELVQTCGYRPAPPFDCPITAYGGLQDESVRREHLEAWGLHTRSTFTLRMIADGHFFVNTCQETLAHTVAHDLNRACHRIGGRGLGDAPGRFQALL